MIDDNSVAVDKESVAVFGVARAQNLNQSVQIKIYSEDAQKFSVLPVNHLRKRHAIPARLRVVVGSRDAEAFGRFFCVDVPRSPVDVPIGFGRFPTVVHYDLMLIIRVGQIANGNFGIVLRDFVQKFYGGSVVVHHFGIFADDVDEHT